MRTRSKGFTLIELMIAAAIISILASIALPAYSDYTRRGRVSEAISSLASWRMQMEQYYQDNNNYGAGGCGRAAPTGKHYTFTCATTNGGQGYTLTATANANNEGTYTLNEANQQATTQFKGSSVTKNCWLIKGGEC